MDSSFQHSGRGDGNRDVYLSVDLDYWAKFLRYANPCSASLFLRRVARSGRPITVGVSHEELLEDLDGRSYQWLINVDTHDDIEKSAYIPQGYSPKEGDWATHVPFRESAIYEWRFPSHYWCVRKRNGLCSDDPRFWEHPRASGWQQVRRRQGVAGIPWRRVDRVFIALSPGYSSWEPVLAPLERLLKVPGVHIGPRVYEEVGRWILEREVRL